MAFGVLSVIALFKAPVFTAPTPDKPILLTMDNHQNHVCFEVIKLARANNIILLTLPPHTNHKLQPLDKFLRSHSISALPQDKSKAQIDKELEDSLLEVLSSLTTLFRPTTP
ncbi:hypothetical protein ILUMI_18228 [Ignelater luminosus]|uniref:DDE-1 domain-containing protein n=1 Tax=Ignelater luminosus TaxID=2038154 RepID=A0A8K0CLQ6_IGNLU|nr:hypothetical protein ILUMI_18228 [Ignelater luminosus]